MLANLDFNKLMGKASFTIQYVFILFAALSLSACGGGDGGGGGAVFGLDNGPVSASANSPTLYSFNVVAGTPYTVALVNTSSETAIYLYNVDPFSVSSPVPFGISWQSGNYEAVSFIASSNATVYALAIPMDPSTTYTIEVTTNYLAVGAASRSDSVYGGGTFGSDLFYSFDALIGATYEVRVTPTLGDVDLARVTLNTDMTGSIGSSLNVGTATDAVFFTATATGPYYIRVDGTNVDSTFGIQVLEVPAGPDLTVVIDSAVSDGTDVTVNYTVNNNGADAYTGDFQVDLWADVATAPGVGLTGDNFVTHTAVTIAGLGGTISGSATIANATESGTAYAVVDTIEAVVEANEGNNVSASVSWQKPLLAPINFDFEDSIIPVKSVMTGDANWLIDSTTGGSSSFKSLRSGSIGNSQKSCFAMSVYNSQSTNISFDRMVSSESFYDPLRFYIDGVQQNSWSGTVAWGNVSFNTTSGLHEYKWCYTKDFMTSSGTDEAWVDNISIISIPPDLSVVVNSATSDGTNVAINYTVANNTNIPVGAFAVDFWSDALSPVVGDTGETSVSHASLAAWASTPGTVTIANAAISGTAYAIVDTVNTVQETNEANNVSSGTAWVITAPDLSVSIIGASSDGTDVTINYTVTNNGAGGAGAFNVDLWADSASTPVVGNTGDTSVAYVSLTAGNSIVDSVVIANAAVSGTAYAIVDTSNVVLEPDEVNNVSIGIAWETPPTAPVMYDFEAGPVPATLSMSGNAAWVLDGANGSGGSAASLVSGVITHNETSCAAVTVLASSNVSFDYNVSSESSFDYLRFYIDGVQQSSWSGAVAWANASYPVITGTHEYKWCYTKDSSASSGSDAAWVDNIIIN